MPQGGERWKLPTLSRQACQAPKRLPAGRSTGSRQSNRPPCLKEGSGGSYQLSLGKLAKRQSVSPQVDPLDLVRVIDLHASRRGAVEAHWNPWRAKSETFVCYKKNLARLVALGAILIRKNWFWDVLDPANRFLGWFCVDIGGVLFFQSFFHDEVTLLWSWWLKMRLDFSEPPTRPRNESKRRQKLHIFRTSRRFGEVECILVINFKARYR